MPLSLTTRRKQQTLSAKWSTHQYNNTDVVATSTNLFRHHQHHSNYLSQPLQKQKSLIENLHVNKGLLTAHTGRVYLSRGLSVGRSQDIQRSSFPQQVLRKQSSITTESYNRKNESESIKTGAFIKRNKTSGEQCVISRGGSRAIIKTLDKELAQLNGVVGNCKDVVRPLKEHANLVDNTKSIKSKVNSPSQSNRKQIKSEVNKVNLSIVLLHALDTSKEENDCLQSDVEVDEEESEDTLSSSGKIKSLITNLKDNKKCENVPNSLKNTSASRPNVPAQQRRSLYHASRLTTNLALSNTINTTTLNCSVQNSQNFNASPSLTVQKRPPLVRAMSAPVRSLDETTKASTNFLNAKRKSRRRKQNTRTINCGKGTCDLLTTKNFNIDSNITTNRRVLTRSKSVAPDVVTLVSLVSSEGSDSEREDRSSTSNNSHTESFNKRAPSLKKTGKSVSFQENYPPTFQFASKEYSHMLRRGSIAPLTQRIKSNRPPTAPPGSIYHITMNNGASEENENNIEYIKNNTSKTLTETVSDKPLEEEYDFPEYVRSVKERECWKLFMKMSAKGVSITYDTILRGMLTPTEFRQLQKQREIEEAKALKKAEDNGLMVETSKRSSTAIERLKESLLKN